MDEDITRLLEDWQVPDTVIAKFRENEIHKDQLKDLTTNDEFLKELCPLIGHRVLVKTKIEEYFTKQTDTATTATNSLTEDDFGDTLALDDISLENLLTPVRPSLPEFYLKTLLSTSPHGKSIIEYYATHNTLTNKHRNLLVDIIVRHIFTRIINYKITPEEYNLLTGKIVVLFPKESSGTYFVRKKSFLHWKTAVCKRKVG